MAVSVLKLTFAVNQVWEWLYCSAGLTGVPQPERDELSLTTLWSCFGEQFHGSVESQANQLSHIA
jgi:hypothetical protein